jgi:hypothetical protein
VAAKAQRKTSNPLFFANLEFRPIIATASRRLGPQHRNVVALFLDLEHLVPVVRVVW